MSAPRPDLDTLAEELEELSRYFRAELDAFGTLLVHLEGGFGGYTLVVWAPWEAGPELLRSSLDARFRGRLVLALAPLWQDATPLTHVLELTRPRRALLVAPGRGLSHRFAGFKEVWEGGELLRVPLSDPRPAAELVRTAPTGVSYRELRRYDPWESPPSPGATGEVEAHLGAAALAAGAVPYGLGLRGLRAELPAALAALGLGAL